MSHLNNNFAAANPQPGLESRECGNIIQKNFGNFESIFCFHSFAAEFLKVHTIFLSPVRHTGKANTKTAKRATMGKNKTNRSKRPFMKLIPLFLLAVATTAFSPLKAQDQNNSGSGGYTFSLKEAIDFAVKNRFSVQDASLDEKIAKQRVREITGIGLPQINGSVEFDDYLKIPTSLIPGEIFGAPRGTYIPVQFGTQYNATIGASASQLLFDGTFLLGLKASKVYVELARKSTQRTKIDVAVAVSKAYYGVVITKKRINALDANITRAQKALSDAQAYLKQGFVEQLDVDRYEVIVNNLEQEKQKFQNAIDLTNYMLKFQLGLPATANVMLTDSAIADNFTAPAADEKADYSKRIELQLLQTQRDLMLLDVKSKKIAYLPTLAAFGTLSTSGPGQKFDYFNPGKHWYATAIVGARLTVPIFDGFQKDARIQQSKLNLQKFENDYKNTQLSLELDVTSALISYQNNLKTLETQRRNLKLAEEVVRVTQIKYKQGVGSNIEVVNAESSLREAQTNYYNSLYDVIVARVDLDRAKGTLY